VGLRLPDCLIEIGLKVEGNSVSMIRRLKWESLAALVHRTDWNDDEGDQSESVSRHSDNTVRIYQYNELLFFRLDKPLFARFRS